MASNEALRARKLMQSSGAEVSKTATEIQKQKAGPFADFPRDTGAADSNFVKASERVVRINVDGRAWLKLGSEIAHYGEIHFERLPMLKAKGISEKLLRTIGNPER